jgi:hypothetical protein
MAQLTSGAYTRIWTPLANDVLLVETADGKSLPVDVLSRGTREQMFVSLRLALVAAYARRGIHLPMVLDDVFVNFDAARTKIAVEVLRDFAREGHQLMVFTCHEHVWRLFAELKVDTRRVPDRFKRNAELDEPVVETLPEVAVDEPPTEAAVEPLAPALESIELANRELELLDLPEEPPEVVLIDEPNVELPSPPIEAPSAEIEYWWHDEPEAAENGTELDTVDPEAEYSWAVEPVIHRPSRW